MEEYKKNMESAKFLLEEVMYDKYAPDEYKLAAANMIQAGFFTIKPEIVSKE